MIFSDNNFEMQVVAYHFHLHMKKSITGRGMSPMRPTHRQPLTAYQMFNVLTFILFGVETINCNIALHCIGREMLQLYWTHFHWMHRGCMLHIISKDTSYCNTRNTNLPVFATHNIQGWNIKLYSKKMREKRKSEVGECFCGEWESK